MINRFYKAFTVTVFQRSYRKTPPLYKKLGLPPSNDWPALIYMEDSIGQPSELSIAEKMWARRQAKLIRTYGEETWKNSRNSKEGFADYYTRIEQRRDEKDNFKK